MMDYPCFTFESELDSSSLTLPLLSLSCPLPSTLQDSQDNVSPGTSGALHLSYALTPPLQFAAVNTGILLVMKLMSWLTQMPTFIGFSIHHQPISHLHILPPSPFLQCLRSGISSPFPLM